MGGKAGGQGPPEGASQSASSKSAFSLSSPGLYRPDIVKFAPWWKEMGAELYRNKAQVFLPLCQST